LFPRQELPRVAFGPGLNSVARFSQIARLFIHVQSMVSIVDLEIARLRESKRNAWLNDPDSNAEFDATITFLRTLKKELANLQKAAFDFPGGKVAEGKLAKVLEGLGAAFQEFWKRDGVKYISKAATIGLIGGGYTLLSSLGVPVPLAAVFAGAVCADKPISRVLKASKGLINIWGSSSQ
jgi:hypothetical protein